MENTTENITVTIDMVRTALKSFGANKQEISNAQLYDALNLKNEKEKDRLRSRLNDLVQAGEVVRVRPGGYVYNFEHRSREGRGYAAVWRFVRKNKPGWSLSECALMVRMGYSHVRKYCLWLEEANYIERVGVNAKKAITYKGTLKADATPETPYPPRNEPDPFEKERVAAATLVRLMLCADPHQIRTGRAIVDACRVLLARFENTVTQVANKENPHVA